MPVRPALALLLASTAVAAALAPSSGTATAAPTVPTAVVSRAAAPCPSRAAHPWCDPRLGPDARASRFVGAMTTQEKVSLLGGQGLTDNGFTGGHTGATVAVPRLGLPAVYFTDGPVGVRQGKATALPIPMALSATWSPALVRRAGQVVGQEAKSKGNDVVYGPSVNLMRTPQGGRTYESYGEETFHNAELGVAWIEGAQSTGVIADIKHFAANNQEGLNGIPPITATDGGRMQVSADMTERTLREVYLPHFEAAVKQGHVGTLMCSYNRINGVYSCQNEHLLTDILRREWHFKGIVLSDYGASHDTVPSLLNGLDFVPAEGLVDRAYGPAQIDLALASGQVPMSVVDRHVHAIVRTLFAYGYFDRRPYRDDDAQIAWRAHDRTALALEQRAITLLKNDGVLPLRPGVRRIAVIGPYADRFVTGGGSGAVSPRAVVTALQGITRRAGRHVTVTYDDGSDATKAAAEARRADVAVVVVGDVQTEGQDKSCLGLNCGDDLVNSQAVLLTMGSSCLQQSCPLNGHGENALVDAVARAQRRTVVVLETGGPVLTPWRDRVAAVVEAWYPGQQGGTALAHVLWGDVDPGGRLPATFPAAPSQVPTATRRQYPGIGNRAAYSEGLDVGYRWYDAHHERPAYAFGAGLSYTTFRYAHLAVRRGGARHAVATVSVDVTDTGRRAGVAVPQLYVSKPHTARLAQPPKQLVGGTSVRIPAGGTARVSFPLDDRSFASWDPRAGHGGAWRALPGCYRLRVGTSSRRLFAPLVVGRGAGCPGAAVHLPTRGRFFLPLPPSATASLRR